MIKYNMSGLFLHLALLLVFPAFLLTACSDDEFQPSSMNPSLEEDELGHVSSFTLQEEHFPLPSDTRSVKVSLIGKGGSYHCFNAAVEPIDGQWRFHLKVPAAERIADGSYVLTLSDQNGRGIPGRLFVNFQDNLVESLRIILPTYMLNGSGTDDDPYLIQNDDDFGMFLINLADDKDVYGAGLKFLQTADVTAPDQSSLIPGRGYWGAPFAGIYDGGGHAIKGLYYHGSANESTDSGIGLFTTLLGNATVENLRMEGVSMSGLYRFGGIIAGESKGEVNLSDISVAGHIEDAYAMGGLVGNVASGTLRVKDAELKVSVKGSSDLGGIVGRITGGATLEVTGVSTPDYHFSVSGLNSVGGIVGRSLGSASISHATLDHKISSEDDDISIIYGTGDGIGGIIGTITADAGTHHLESCYVKCPVGSNSSNVGGMVGQIFSHSALELADCRMYSVVSGNSCVGGFIGKADLPTDAEGVKIIGDDLSNRVAADDADAKVKGTENIGGFAGYWKGNLVMESKLRINVPINGDKAVGGAFGYIEGSTLNVEKFAFGPANTSVANTMRVQGDVRIGGLVGYIHNSTLRGANKFDYTVSSGNAELPNASRFVSNFNGVVDGRLDVGGIVGYAVDSPLQYLSSSATVTGSTNIGGVVGNYLASGNATHVEDCTFTGTISCANASKVGGIAGYFESRTSGSIKDCINYASVRGGVDTGGIIGCFGKGDPADSRDHIRLYSIKWCVNAGAVNGSEHIGGIVGLHKVVGDPEQIWLYDPNFNITHCMNAGKITGSGNSTSTHGIGGIIGYSGAFISVTNSANIGHVMGSGPFHGIGGIGGSMGIDPTLMYTTYRNLDVYECANTGEIDADNPSSMVGGILGFQEEGEQSDIHDCYNTGGIPCDQKRDTGGIVGYVDHMTNIRRCVNSGYVAHGNATIGTHKSGSLFDHSALYFREGSGGSWPNAKKVSVEVFNWTSSYDGLDFDKVWMMTNVGPKLRDCPWQNYR